MGKYILVIFIFVLFGILMYKMNNPTNQTMPLPPAATESAVPGQTASPSAQEVNETQVVIKTSKGDIGLALFPKEAPKTVANFIEKAKKGYYKELTFHRVEDWVIQGGDPLGNGTGGGDIDTELNDKPFVVGSLGVARAGDIRVSNDSQFFITKKDSSFLNRQYTNFGLVTSGMDVVNKIEVGDKIIDVAVK